MVTSEIFPRLFTLPYFFFFFSGKFRSARIERFPVRTYLLVLSCTEGAGAGVDSGGGENEGRRTVPRLLIRFDTHPRWAPVTKGLHLHHFTKKMRDWQ